MPLMKHELGRLVRFRH